MCYHCSLAIKMYIGSFPLSDNCLHCQIVRFLVLVLYKFVVKIYSISDNVKMHHIFEVTICRVFADSPYLSYSAGLLVRKFSRIFLEFYFGFVQNFILISSDLHRKFEVCPSELSCLRHVLMCGLEGFS